MSRDFESEPPKQHSYALKLTRRESLTWMAAMTTSATTPLLFQSRVSASSTDTLAGVADWPELKLTPVNAHGYGKDPVLISPAPAPWPLTLTSAQLNLVAVLSDIIIPAEDDVPSASAVGVPDVINEWISAPYPLQQQHRSLVMSGLVWMDRESVRRSDKLFVKASGQQQLDIVHDIAFSSTSTPADLNLPAMFFDGFRLLVCGAFFSSPEGIEDIGYLGNTPLKGDYPGPTPEALAHLNALLEELGLEL